MLRMIDELTNGTKTKLNETGTRLVFTPGFIIGGDLTVDCGTGAPLGYFLEVLVCLAAFSKKKFNVTLQGVTHGHGHPNVDTIKQVTLSYCKKLGLHSAELTITKRGYPPLGGGEVLFSCNTLKVVKPFQWLDQGKIKRIRGVASCSRMSPATNPRVIDKSRGILNSFLPDVYIYNEHLKGEKSGKSPGHSLTLYTESTTEVVLCVDNTASQQTLPEQLATDTVHQLLDAVHCGGCVDGGHQFLVLLFMALTEKNVSSVRFGPLTPYSISFLKNIKLFFGVVFKIKVDNIDTDETGNKKGLGSTLILSCLGVGFTNMNRSIL